MSNSLDPDQARHYVIVGKITCFYNVCCLLNFFQNQLFRKTLSGIPSECKTIWIQIRPDKNVGPDLGLKCLKKLSADNTNRQRVKLRNAHLTPNLGTYTYLYTFARLFFCNISELLNSQQKSFLKSIIHDRRDAFVFPRAENIAFILICFALCHFPIGILGHVWYLIVLIPYLCTLTYFAQCDWSKWLKCYCFPLMTY